MFRCEMCKTVAPAGTSSRRVVTETRAAEYPSRGKAQRQRVGRKLKHSDDPGGAGYEIAREALVCVPCALAFERKQAEEAGAAEAV